MSIIRHKIDKVLERFKLENTYEKITQTQANPPAVQPGVPFLEPYSEMGQQTRLNFIREQCGKEMPFLGAGSTFNAHQSLEGNIENYIGMSQIPTGLAGPIAISGSVASGEFYVPMATTEGALIASYGRGMKACRESGWITSVCLIEGVQRSPMFKFKDFKILGQFVMWVIGQKDELELITTQSSRFARLNDLKLNIEGNCVIIALEFVTGDAAGQNMVTLSTNAICEYIVQNTPIEPVVWFIESNYSGDKKATALSFSNVRGKKVTAEVHLTRDVVLNTLKSTPELMAEYWQSSTLAVIESGSIGAQGHIANGLTAMFIACGQDVACIAEAAVGITRMQVTDDGGLYCAVTMPNLIVGTVGGGTHLPTQRECLELIGCTGEGSARKFAEICGAVALAGEISIAAAISAGHFARAHQILGRKKTNHADAK
jgi:hydroxymethylglutaryl-CoA reductase (NADPH)